MHGNKNDRPEQPYGESGAEKQEQVSQSASSEKIAEEQLDNIVGGQSNKKPYLDDIDNLTVGKPPKDAQGGSL